MSNEQEKRYIAEQMYEMEELGVVTSEESEELMEDFGGVLASIFNL